MKCIEEEIPFEVPEGWEWCRIRDIAAVKGGKRVPKGCSLTDDVTEHAYIRVTDMKNNTILLDDIKYIDDDIYEKIKAYTISDEDLYITVAGTIGAVGTVPFEMDGMNLTENAVKATNIQINKNYLCYVIQSELVQNQFQDKTHHVAMPKLAIERILSTFIPVPPYEEQVRINKIIKEIINNIEIVDEEKSILKDTVDITKAKVLDLAIRGKLVQQDSKDEPASVLLTRIRAEKEALIKQGKLKRDKKESIIYKGDDNSYYMTGKKESIELPFNLPNGWTWVCLPEIVFFQEGPGIMKKDFCEEGIPLIRISGLQTERVTLEGCNYLSPQKVEEKWAHFKLEKGDIVICTSASIGKVSIVDEEAVGAIPYTGQIRFQMTPAITKAYFLFFAMSNIYLDQVNMLKTGNCIQHYGPTHLKQVIVPLPPINEQIRISKTISKYLDQIDLISDQIT